MSFDSIRPASVLAAANRIRPFITRTPLRRSQALSQLTHHDVWLKLETEQVTGSFKARGAFNAIALLPGAERAKGVVASSAGNHGMGVALAARHFSVRATIFVPGSAPDVKKKGIQALGATVDASQPDYDSAMRLALDFASRTGAHFIHPCLGDNLIAGQGTVAAEILEELPELGTLVLPVGGGGLLGGSGALLRAISPGTTVVGAQSVLTAAMARSLAAGKVVPIPSEPTLADGLAGGIDEFALEVGQRSLDDIVLVEEDSIARAIRWLHSEEGITAEGSGAVGVAALLEGRIQDITSPVAVIVSGGNIDRERLSRILESGQ